MNSKKYKSLVVTTGLVILLLGSEVFAVGMGRAGAAGQNFQNRYRQQAEASSVVPNLRNQEQIQTSRSTMRLSTGGQRRGLAQGPRQGQITGRNENQNPRTTYSQDWLDGYKQGLADAGIISQNANQRPLQPRALRQGQRGIRGAGPVARQRQGLGRGQRQGQPAPPEVMPNARPGQGFGRGLRQGQNVTPRVAPNVNSGQGIGRGLRQGQRGVRGVGPNAGQRVGQGRGFRRGAGRGQVPIQEDVILEEVPVEEPNM